ncbi:nitroreductase family deazaflavin-dependent oxidoreductase [Promicromonospora thailandica]|uniref:Deazaflavin-dependent oxidoreductase, nitroreductase family n=2 Tax=Promicromonospora thailandica TaxID=765201 RepID=A0A9X2G4X5_9MICO|nr:deazaflavin-dependent oxidoreductase, nitroreductase family [Promicromonospora thailandica]
MTMPKIARPVRRRGQGTLTRMDPLSAAGAWILRTRWLVRAPIAVYRAGLGRLLGSRVLMLEHRGRTSGRTRFVCLEVVERSTPDTMVVVSGFGERSQWYQNLRARPECFVSQGRVRRARATARFLSDGEAATILARYQQRRPADWRMLKAALERATGRSVTHLPMVELVLGPGPR